MLKFPYISSPRRPINVSFLQFSLVDCSIFSQSPGCISAYAALCPHVFFPVMSNLSFDISVSSYRLFSNVSAPVLFVLIFLLTLYFYLTFTVSYCSLLFNCIPSATITLFIFIYPSPPSHFTPSCIFSSSFLVQCYKCPPLRHHLKTYTLGSGL